MTTPDGLTESEDEAVARAFHEAYERLAPQFGYRTREASAVPWEDVPQANRDLMVATVASVKHVILARHVRDTGCDGLREALRRLIDAIETTGLHEHDDGRGGVDLCIPISGIRGVMNDACEAAGHEFLHPEDVPPFCRWCGAATARSAGEPDALEAARATCISALQETWQRVYRLRPVVDAAVRWSTSTDEADTNALLAAVEAYERAIQPEEAPK